MIIQKKQVIVEAVLYKGINPEGPSRVTQVFDTKEVFSETPIWLHEALANNKIFEPKREGQKLRIRTLEGDMYVDDGDYIVCGIQGELYPVKPDTFHQTYEILEEYSY